MLGILDSGIELMRKGEKEPITFCSFQDRDLAFARFKALWKMVSPHAVNVEMSDDEEGEDLSNNGNVYEENGGRSRS